MPRTPGPKAQLIKSQKAKFLEELSSNGGNVLLAIEASGLAKRTAYDHYEKDDQFRAEWIEAMRASVERLYAEALRRATTSEVSRWEEGGKVIVRHRQASDRLLMYLIERGDRDNNWKLRIGAIANAAVNSAEAKAREWGLQPHQIASIRNAMIDEMAKVPLN